jgi:hypothetical protein
LSLPFRFTIQVFVCIFILYTHVLFALPTSCAYIWYYKYYFTKNTKCEVHIMQVCPSLWHLYRLGIRSLNPCRGNRFFSSSKRVDDTAAHAASSSRRTCILPEGKTTAVWSYPIISI